MALTSRDTAVLFWLAIFFAWGLSHAPIRRSVAGLIRMAIHRSILVFFIFLTMWITGEVLILQKLGLWTTEQLKDTILWTVLTGIATGVNAVRSHDNPNYRTFLTDSLKIMVVLEFIIALVPFSLPIEMVLVPSLACLGLLSGYTGYHPEYARVKNLLDIASGATGLCILTAAILRAVDEYSTLANMDLLRSFVLPLTLSLIFLPAIFLLTLSSRYEWLFAKIRGGRRYRIYAKLRLIIVLGARPQQVLEFGRRQASKLPHAQRAEDLEALIASDKIDMLIRKTEDAVLPPR